MSCPVEVERIQSALHSRGNHQLEGVFSENELTEAEQVLNRLMRSSSALVRPFRHSIHCEQALACQQLELIRPCVLSRALRHSAVFSKAQALASELLGTRAHYQFDHAIYKSPQAAAVPWHQDQAYSGPAPASLHFWIPFQDSGPDNGGMMFIDESRQALLGHRPVTPNSRTLTLSQPVEGRPRHARVSRGGLSVHHNFTLHASGENRSNQSRKAWILHFASTRVWQKYWHRFRQSLS